MRAGVRPGDPHRRSLASRQAAVGADGELQRHGGAAFGDAEDVAERDRCRLLGEHALLDLDAGGDQPLDAARPRCAGLDRAARSRRARCRTRQ